MKKPNLVMGIVGLALSLAVVYDAFIKESPLHLGP